MKVVVVAASLGAGVAVSSLAHAGEDTGGPASTSGEGGSEGSRGESGGWCGDCSSNATQTVTIDSPSTGATVPGAFTVSSSATPECYCDDCGCSDGEVWKQRVLVDGVPTGSECEGTPCSFGVEIAAAGTHTITVEAEYTYDTESVSITVEVDPAATGGGGEESGEEGGEEGGEEAGEEAGGGGDSDGSNAEPDGGASPSNDSKSGCSVGGPDRSEAAFGLMLLALVAGHRRRRAGS